MIDAQSLGVILSRKMHSGGDRNVTSVGVSAAAGADAAAKSPAAAKPRSRSQCHVEMPIRAEPTLPDAGLEAAVWVRDI
jgi:hypothetical protein